MLKLFALFRNAQRPFLTTTTLKNSGDIRPYAINIYLSLHHPTDELRPFAFPPTIAIHSSAPRCNLPQNGRSPTKKAQQLSGNPLKHG